MANSFFEVVAPTLPEAISLNVFPSIDFINKFGRNADIDTGTGPEDVWGGGGVYTGQPFTDPDFVEVFSSSADDTSDGTGARTIIIEGLKTPESSYYEREQITMNGTTAVLSQSRWYRVSRNWVTTAGSGETNAGTITIRHQSTPANIFSVMPINRGQSQIACWSLPAKNTFYLTEIGARIARTSGAAGSAEGGIQFRQREGSAWRTRENLDLQTGFDFKEEFELPSRFTADDDHPIDFRFRIFSVSDNNTFASARFTGWYGLQNNINKMVLGRLGLESDDAFRGVSEIG